MTGRADNPCELNGFAFVEFSGPNTALFHQLFTAMGFHVQRKHTREDIVSYQQGNILFIVNGAPNTQAAQHHQVHGSGACAMGFRVHDAQAAFQYAIAHGAREFHDAAHAHHRLPAIEAIGGSVIYFVDAKTHPFQGDSHEIPQRNHQKNCSLIDIDHLTHNVCRGNMNQWAAYYENIFNFHEIRHFDIKGKMTGLLSRAMGSPCGKIKIPLNESKDEKSQIEEFLHEYHGEGIQHIALATTDIYHSVECMRTHDIRFLDVPDTYYEMITDRIPWHHEPLNALKEGRILIDGEKTPDKGLLLQIFTENVFGPVFFELIQRKGNESFGEGNFQALFEAIERDQIRRGTLLV